MAASLGGQAARQSFVIIEPLQSPLNILIRWAAIIWPAGLTNSFQPDGVRGTNAIGKILALASAQEDLIATIDLGAMTKNLQKHLTLGCLPELQRFDFASAIGEVFDAL